MDSDELIKVDFYLSELRSLRSLHLSSQHIDMLETSTKTMKTAIDSLLHSKIKYSSELLDSEETVHNLRTDCDRWEQLVCKTMTLVDDAHTKIASLSQAVVRLIDSNETARIPATVENAQNEAAAEIQSVESSDRNAEQNEENNHVYRCTKCPRTFGNLAPFYRHGVKSHGTNSPYVQKKKLKKAKGRMTNKMVRDAVSKAIKIRDSFLKDLEKYNIE